VIYLTLPELLHVAERTLGAGYEVRDYGLLESALARPQATAFGKDAYPDLDAKAAALLHSIARNHALIDGNKRLALAAVIAFYGLNGRRLILTNDEAYDLVIGVAAGQLDDVEVIAATLRNATRPRRLSDSAGPHAQAPDRRLGAGDGSSA
jgi:death on curing protein